MKAVKGLGLTAEELESAAAQIKERPRAYHREYRLRDIAKFKAHMRKHRRSAKGKTTAKNFEAKTMASEKYYCELCDVRCSKPYKL